MYNKFAKVVSIAILLFTIPNNTLALNKDGLFTNLIRYSYPEVKVIEKDDTDTKDKQNEDQTTTSKETKISKQFVNVYVGEDNIPTAKKSDNNGISLESAVYSSNLRVTNNKPQILI